MVNALTCESADSQFNGLAQVIEVDPPVESAGRPTRPPLELGGASFWKRDANHAGLNDMPIFGGESAEQERPSTRRRQSERHRLGEGIHDAHRATHDGVTPQRGECPILADLDVDNRFVGGTASPEYYW